MFICAHCEFTTASDAVYQNHIKKCEEMQKSGSENLDHDVTCTGLEEVDNSVEIPTVKPEEGIM